ncbi:hypothetical protein [Azospirillum palustre]
MAPFREIADVVKERGRRRPASASLGVFQVPFDALLSGRLRWHGMGFVPGSVHGCPY